MQEMGKISHYFTRLGVAIVELSNPLKVGDKVHIKGATTDFTQVVGSMQVEHQPIQEAKAGQSIGLKVEQHVRPGDSVFKE